MVDISILMVYNQLITRGHHLVTGENVESNCHKENHGDVHQENGV